MTQSSQKCFISEDCDYDSNRHKMIAVIFLRIAIMITVLIKCTLYKECNHDRSPKKNVMFLRLYTSCPTKQATPLQLPMCLMSKESSLL